MAEHGFAGRNVQQFAEVAEMLRDFCAESPSGQPMVKLLETAWSRMLDEFRSIRSLSTDNNPLSISLGNTREVIATADRAIEYGEPLAQCFRDALPAGPETRN